MGSGAMDGGAPNTFLFVVWSEARAFEGRIVEEIGKRFRIVRSFEVAWPKRHFAENLASFYGWRNRRVWWNKVRKCGDGPFLAVVVEDPHPVWSREHDTSGHELTVNENVYRLKKSFRALTGRSNVVHSSVTPEETAHQLAALSDPCDSPIPFRKMRYPDDERIRAERRGVWLGVLADMLVPLLLAVATGAIVWTDLFVLKTGCAENHLVEWSGLVASALSGAVMAWCAFARKRGRGASALFAAFFLDMAVREADYVLDRMFGARVWPWALTAITLAFAFVTLRYAKTVYAGLRDIRESRLFPLFACGASLMLFAGLLMGRPETWRSIGVQTAPGSGNFMEESVELFGYALMLAWSLSYAFRRDRRRSAPDSPRGDCGPSAPPEIMV